MSSFHDVLNWLNPSHWSGPAVIAVRVLLIIVVTLVLDRILQRIVRVFRERLMRDIDDVERAKRLQTLERVSRYLLAVVMWLVAGTLVLSELNISIAPILGAAGVAGVAIGFGAQSLIKDYVSGFFLLLENQLRQGDVVELGGKAGLVEEITLRYVRLRDYGGNVHYIPNGLVTTVTNMSRDFSHAVMDIGVAYREDVDEAMEIMREVGGSLRADPKFGSKILDDLEIAGVDRWDDSAVTLRCRLKVIALEQWTIRREYLRRLKKEFDARGIEIPFPHLTVYAGIGKDGSAPPFHFRSARPELADATE
ncbi:MAG: mechanosensitive ion channel [Betaproteobacteria bacterium]|nr:mechanosensitive ion channel [Betaproteobacteria bacterium]